MPKRYSTKEILKVLNKKDFFEVGQTGSHIRLHNENGQTVIVPANQKVMAVGTFASILRQSQISQKEFEMLVKK